MRAIGHPPVRPIGAPRSAAAFQVLLAAHSSRWPAGASAGGLAMVRVLGGSFQVAPALPERQRFRFRSGSCTALGFAAPLRGPARFARTHGTLRKRNQTAHIAQFRNPLRARECPLQVIDVMMLRNALFWPLAGPEKRFPLSGGCEC